MRIAYVVHNYKDVSTPQALLDVHYTAMDWVQSLAEVGITVFVFYRFSSNHQFSIGNIQFHFIADRLPPALKPYHTATHFHKKVAQWVKERNVDVIHAHNPFALMPNFTLRRLTKGCKMLIQDHSGRQQLPRKRLLKIAMRQMNAVVFASKGQEKQWLENGILSEKQCYFVMENSSNYVYEDRVVARQKTKLKGKPIFLWVGNLDANKDPYTALKAFGKFAKNCPSAHLYMIYRLSAHEEEVRLFVEKDDALSQCVTMLGRQSRADLEAYYNSGDYIISASFKEGSGFSVIEAMSCGVIPIVTSIPSFISLTGNGKIGSLYKAGNVDMLYEKLVNTMDHDIHTSSRATLEYFENNFSFTAMANKMKGVYLSLLQHHD